MKDFFAMVIGLFLFLSFVLDAFGIWPTWTMIAGILAGFIYMIFTDKNRQNPLDKWSWRVYN